MTSEETEAERPMGVERIAFFSDAVVAIAITLVALPLVDAARDLGDESVGTFLHRNIVGLSAAASSFFAITLFWIWHHRFYQKVTAYTSSLLWANAVWLACIVFLPVATVVNVTTHAADRVGVMLYLGTLTASIAMDRVQELIAARRGLTPSLSRRTPREEAAEWLGVVFLLVCIAVASVNTAAGLWALLILLLLAPAKRLVRGRDVATGT